MITLDDLAGKAVVTVPETSQLLGLSERSVRRGLEAGELPCIRVGRRTLIPAAPLRALLGLPKNDETAPATGTALATDSPARPKLEESPNDTRRPTC